MENKFDFLVFLLEKGFVLAEPNEGNYTHWYNNGEYYIGFKYCQDNKYEFSTSFPDKVITSTNPKNEEKAKEILEKVLKFPYLGKK